MIKRLHTVENAKKTIELSNMGQQTLKWHMKGKQHIKNAETTQCFFRSTEKSNDNNEIFTVHMPNSSQIQTNKNKETQQLNLSFVSKSSLSKRKVEILFTLKSIVSNWSANSIDGMSQLSQCMFTDSEIGNE